MAWKRFISASDVALFTSFVLFRYRWVIRLPNIVFGPFFLIHSLAAAIICGLFLRIATASWPPVRRATSGCRTRAGSSCFQNSAR